MSWLRRRRFDNDTPTPSTNDLLPNLPDPVPTQMWPWQRTIAVSTQTTMSHDHDGHPVAMVCQDFQQRDLPPPDGDTDGTKVALATCIWVCPQCHTQTTSSLITKVTQKDA